MKKLFLIISILLILAFIGVVIFFFVKCRKCKFGFSLNAKCKCNSNCSSNCLPDGTCPCPKNCSGNGECNENGTCKCLNNYTGDDCSTQPSIPSIWIDKIKKLFEEYGLKLCPEANTDSFWTNVSNDLINSGIDINKLSYADVLKIYAIVSKD